MAILFPREICLVICEYSTEYTLKPWAERIRDIFSRLMCNERAVDLIIKSQHTRSLNVVGLAHNPRIAEIMPHLTDRLVNVILRMDSFASNKHAIDIIRKNLDKISWPGLSSNENAVDILRANPSRINWYYLSMNPAAIDILKANPSKIDWVYLSANPSAIELLKANPSKIDWPMLSTNTNPLAIEMLKANLHLVDWVGLSGNPSAIELLEANLHLVDWWGICNNENASDIIEKNHDKVHPTNIGRHPVVFEAIVNPSHLAALLEI